MTDPTIDPLIDHGRELMRFVDSLVSTDADRIRRDRAALESAAGREAMVRAAAVAANFQMMNRLVDATGVPIGASLREIAGDLGLQPNEPAR